jgi:hypothetical protein
MPPRQTTLWVKHERRHRESGPSPPVYLKNFESFHRYLQLQCAQILKMAVTPCDCYDVAYSSGITDKRLRSRRYHCRHVFQLNAIWARSVSAEYSQRSQNLHRAQMVVQVRRKETPGSRFDVVYFPCAFLFE